MIEVLREYWPIYAIALVFAVIFLRPRSAEAPIVTAPERRFEGQVEAYGLDADSGIMPIGCPALADAEALVRERYRASAGFFEHGEDALAATSIGFSRSADDFIEVNCIGADGFEVRAGRAASGASEEQILRGTGLVDLMRLVEAYYAGPDVFAARWAARLSA